MVASLFQPPPPPPFALGAAGWPVPSAFVMAVHSLAHSRTCNQKQLQPRGFLRWCRTASHSHFQGSGQPKPPRLPPPLPLTESELGGANAAVKRARFVGERKEGVHRHISRKQFKHSYYNCLSPLSSQHPTTHRHPITWDSFPL